jgi:hypothetical protein
VVHNHHARHLLFLFIFAGLPIYAFIPKEARNKNKKHATKLTAMQSYDAMDNLINNGSQSYSYDVAERMVAVSAGGSSAAYQVNDSGAPWI